MKAGVLALQGDFREHARMFAECGATPILIRTPDELAQVDCLAIPAGESTTIGKLATPADAALMMQLGADGNFVGSGIFKSEDPASRARAIVEATTYFNDPDMLAKVSRGLGEPMRGIEISTLGEEGLLQTRGW